MEASYGGVITDFSLTISTKVTVSIYVHIES